MTQIKPFRAIRPTRDKVHLVATLPYYDYKKHVLQAKMEHNPFTFLHVINPEFHDLEKSVPNSDERFLKTKNKFQEFIDEGIFIQEKTDCLYLYRQTKDGHEYLGLIGGASVDQYNSGHIKKHEETITVREEVFTRYLKITEFNAEPILLFHEENANLTALLSEITTERPEYEFSSTEYIKHEVWVVRNIFVIEKIQECYKKITDVYIADGHHRCASSAKFSNSLGQNKTDIQNYFLAYFISDNGLRILNYNRVVKDLNGLSEKEFLQKISNQFNVEKIDPLEAQPKILHDISMYLNNLWYKLTPKENTFDSKHPVNSLDTAILSDNLLTPILNIIDLKTDRRIEFISGNKGIEAIQNSVNLDVSKVGFVLFPVSVHQLKKVADENLIMPPKSTWIEPKLRSGLTIYPLK